MSQRPTIPEVFDAFAAYFRREPVWGPLHAVLDEGNISDDNVESCIAWARELGDAEGVRLGELLLRMTPTQRRKLPLLVYRQERGYSLPLWPKAGTP